MHHNCFVDLINDYRIQRQYGSEQLTEKRDLSCAQCGQYIMRDNPQCPRCIETKKFFEDELTY